MEIVWTKSAFTALEEIGNFIATDSPSRAVRFIDQLTTSVARLSKFPFSAPLLPQHPAFRQLLYKEYRIIYRVTASVEIIAICSPRQEFSVM